MSVCPERGFYCNRACSHTSCSMYHVFEVCAEAHWLCVVLFAALKSPAAFHEQIRSLERARVSAWALFFANTKSQDLYLSKCKGDLYGPLRYLNSLTFCLKIVQFFSFSVLITSWRYFHNFNLHLISL